MGDTIQLPETHDAGIANADSRLGEEGVTHGWGDPPGDKAEAIQFRLRYRGLDRDCWVVPAAGVWANDVVSAACRRLCGSSKGSARPVQGQGVIEFREWWDSPTSHRVREEIEIAVENDRGVQVATEKCIIATACMPGCDVPSVLLAAAYAVCQRKYGPGELQWVPRRDTKALFKATGVYKTPEMIPYRCTVVVAGEPHEMMVAVPRDVATNWKAIIYQLGIACRSRFGLGKLTYEPELGEVYYRFDRGR